MKTANAYGQASWKVMVHFQEKRFPTDGTGTEWQLMMCDMGCNPHRLSANMILK